MPRERLGLVTNRSGIDTLGEVVARPEPIVELTEVTKVYRMGDVKVPAVRGVSLSIVRGEFAALVGPSGSGKSTLLHLIGCLDEPDEGQVVIDDARVNGMTDAERSALRSRRIGFVFQSFNLVPVLSAYENIELPLLIWREIDAVERRRRVQELLEAVDLTAFSRHLPDRLSGGQRQRVAIARALVTRPAIVLADEPTANLDSETAMRIVDLMKELNGALDVTFLFSTHDEKLMGRVERLIRLRDGVLVV